MTDSYSFLIVTRKPAGYAVACVLDRETRERYEERVPYFRNSRVAHAVALDRAWQLIEKKRSR